MEPIRGEIDIGVLNRLLRVWKQRKLSSSQQMRMLRLLLGCEFKPLMDKDGRYPRGNLSEIGRILSYKTISLLLADIRKADCFIIKMMNGNEVEYVSSPMWERCAQSAGEVGETYTVATTLRSKAEGYKGEDNINNKNKKNNFLEEKEAEKEDFSLNKRKLKNLRELLPENIQTVQDFFKRLKDNPETDYEFYTRYIVWFKKRGYSQKWAEKITLTMWDNFTRGYLAKNIEFLEANDLSRVIILRTITWRQEGKPNWFGTFIGAAIKETDDLIKQENEQRYKTSETRKHWS